MCGLCALPTITYRLSCRVFVVGLCQSLGLGGWWAGRTAKATLPLLGERHRDAADAEWDEFSGFKRSPPDFGGTK